MDDGLFQFGQDGCWSKIGGGGAILMKILCRHLDKELRYKFYYRDTLAILFLKKQEKTKKKKKKEEEKVILWTMVQNHDILPKSSGSPSQLTTSIY